MYAGTDEFTSNLPLRPMITESSSQPRSFPPSQTTIVIAPFPNQALRLHAPDQSLDDSEQMDISLSSAMEAEVPARFDGEQ